MFIKPLPWRGLGRLPPSSLAPASRSSETYVHRIGRTGRAGASGIALSFCDMEEREFLRDIHKLIDQTIPVVEGHPYASDMKFVQTPVVQKNPLSRRPASHSGFRKARSWSQGRGR